MTQEIKDDLINYEWLDEKHPSGSRTLLRLHRAFKMVELILRKVGTNEHGGKMSKIVYDSYHQSPMPAYHSWVCTNLITVRVRSTCSFLSNIAA